MNQNPTPLDKITFDYLTPTSEQKRIMDEVRVYFHQFADMLEKQIPPGPDKTYLLRKLREVGMWANIAITRNADGSQRT